MSNQSKKQGKTGQHKRHSSPTHRSHRGARVKGGSMGFQAGGSWSSRSLGVSDRRLVQAVTKDEAFNVRTTVEVRDRAQAVFEELGLSLSGAVNLLMARLISTRRLPFIPEPLTEADGSPALAEAGQATAVRIRVDATLKHQVTVLLQAMGFNPTVIVNAFLRTVAAQRDIPFDYRAPNEETRRAMAELDQGQGERFDSVDALFSDLED
ncbi:type II toxin-antitoxin system RelB/DinJ family antitoxin [Marinobacter algicola]|nr:type II toxin-antitoxin system RelB/DinJ family antitoxin [Marinobacter algicola]